MPKPIEIKIPTAVILASFLNYAAAFSPIVIMWSLFCNPAGSYLSFNSNLHTLLLGPAGSLLFTIYFGSGFFGGGLTPYFISLAIYCLFILYVADGLQSGEKNARNFQINLSSIFIFFSGVSIFLSIASIFNVKFYISIYVFITNLIIFLSFRNNRKINEFFLNRELPVSCKARKIKIIIFSSIYIIIMTLTLLYLNNRAKAITSIVSQKQEMVMNKGMKIIAEAPEGKIEIYAEDSFVRTYSWGSCIRPQTLFPRKDRWNGSLGAYFPGPNPSWKLCDGIDGSLLEEGQMHFNTVDEALLWINSGKQFRKGSSVYNNDGLLVSFGKNINPSGKSGTLNVSVCQIYINGSKPNGFNGSDESKITIKNNNGS
jgi:hypothetical protein